MSDLRQQNIFISEEAIDMAYLLYEDENNKSLNLRISVEGGGCSGFKYNFTFDDKINNDDNIIDLKNNLKLTIDFLSLQYLQGATIDFKNDMEGAQFVIENPNATSTCGCGNSFSI